MSRSLQREQVGTRYRSLERDCMRVRKHGILRSVDDQHRDVDFVKAANPPCRSSKCRVIERGQWVRRTVPILRETCTVLSVSSAARSPQ